VKPDGVPPPATLVLPPPLVRAHPSMANPIAVIAAIAETFRSIRTSVSGSELHDCCRGFGRSGAWRGSASSIKLVLQLEGLQQTSSIFAGR
jgi:hypothetical protein